MRLNGAGPFDLLLNDGPPKCDARSRLNWSVDAGDVATRGISMRFQRQTGPHLPRR